MCRGKNKYYATREEGFEGVCKLERVTLIKTMKQVINVIYNGAHRQGMVDINSHSFSPFSCSLYLHGRNVSSQSKSSPIRHLDHRPMIVLWSPASSFAFQSSFHCCQLSNTMSCVFLLCGPHEIDNFMFFRLFNIVVSFAPIFYIHRCVWYEKSN